MIYYLCSCIRGLGLAYAAYIHACVARFYVYMDLFMHSHICSWVHTYVVSNLRMRVWCLRSQTRACVCMTPIRNPILNPISFVSYLNTVCVHAYVDLTLHTQLIFMHAWLGFMRTWNCSCIHIYVLEFMRMWFPTCVCVFGAYVRRHKLACAWCQSGTLF